MNTDRIIEGFLVLLIAGLVAFTVWACFQPSCEERGGTPVQQGYIYVWQVINFKTGAGVLLPHPNVVCTNLPTK